MKQLDTPVVVINIIALVVLGGSALFAMIVVPAIEAARPTPTVAVTPRPTRPTATQTPTATLTLTPLVYVSPTGPTPTRPANCAPLPPQTSLAQLTSTPLPVDFRYDLDPNIAPSLKTVVVIYRCNGTWVEYWMGPGRTISNSIYLAAGDIIWLIVPPTGATPTLPATPTPSSTLTPTP